MNKNKKIGYPVKETLYKKKLKKGVLIPSTHDKSFQIDIFYFFKLDPRQEQQEFRNKFLKYSLDEKEFCQSKPL